MSFISFDSPDFRPVASSHFFRAALIVVGIVIDSNLEKNDYKGFFLLFPSFDSALVDIPCTVSEIGSILLFFHSHILWITIRVLLR
jgi:hypothetical protein